MDIINGQMTLFDSLGIAAAAEPGEKEEKNQTCEKRNCHGNRRP